tara:strand:- start:8185 stop:8778 length:594 start_codon:yes stop_codon:yes gene_type:complete
MKKATLLMALSLLMTLSISAQRINVVEGKPNFLKGQRFINIEFDYSDMTVGKKTEEAYVNEKVSEKNAKEAGEGDKWLESWTSSRESRYEPKFIELFSKYSPVKITPEEEQEYTLIVHTFFTDPGFNIGIKKRPSMVSFEYIFVETANPDNVVAILKQERVPGSQVAGFDYDVGSRIAESYAKGGKSLSKMLAKVMK